MMDEEFDELLRDAAATYNPPPEPPRDAMWAAISKARDAEGVVPIVAPRRTPRWLQTAVAAAAVLLVGIAIGRFTGRTDAPSAVVATAKQAGTTPSADSVILPSTEEAVGAGAADTPPATRVASSVEPDETGGRNAVTTAARGARIARPTEAADRATDATSYRFAIVEHLTRAEVLLTGFRAQERTAGGAQLDAQFASLARELLGTTRLLLATRRSDDPAITRLLEDLELVLMQLSQYAKDGRRIDLDAINQSLDKRNVLPKLRSTIPAGVSASAGT